MATDMISETNLPVYYKYRYTFGKTEQELEYQKMKLKDIIKFICDHYLLGEKIVAGIEHYTKGMLPSKAHCHIHFMSKKSSDTIRKGLAREFSMVGRCQSCKAEVLVDNPKFWRYPLKQQKNETLKNIQFKGFDKEEIIQMRDVAYDCWKASAEVLVGKLEKKLERTSKDRLFVYLDTQECSKDIRSMCCMAYQYFAENEDTVCIRTIDGYVNAYMLTKKLITPQQMYDAHH